MAAQNDPSIDWAKLERLFPDLLESPAERRAGFLDRHCRDEPALRAELEAMLAASERDSVLDHMPQVRAQGVDGTDGIQPLAADTRVGAWRIVRMIGRGGMGEVYLAQRADGGFAQQAAIKLLHGDAARHAQRFEEERRILAQLSHPNIARLLDGGLHGERAWMAMEFIEGRSITEHCHSRGLPLSARLKLFHQVCAAVAHAHASLIIHRDLKPSNILVNDAGQVKLLDFGIAKLIDPNVAPLPTHTTAFTPDHAAPEQIEGGQVTTATDIYALGVVLYETLGGRLPWSFGDTPLSRAIDRLLREDPPPMSGAATEVGAGAVPAQELQGDLDAVVARCLRRLPQDRYATVQALQEDLDRHARREPVLARQGGRSYVVRLWLRRHRMFAAAAAVACLSLLAGLGLALWQAGIARERAQQAQQQAQRAAQVKDLVLSIFREQDPLSRGKAENRPPAKIIGEGVRALNARLVNDPALHGELMDDLGELQTNVGDLQGGQQTLATALQERSALYGNDSTQAAVTLRKLAFAEQLLGRNDEARNHASRALDIWTRNKQPHSIEAARAKVILGSVLVNQKERDQAFAFSRAAVDDLTRELGPNHPETIDALSRQVRMLIQANKDKEVEAGLRNIIARIEATEGRESARLITPLTTLGWMSLGRLRNFDEAEKTLPRAIALTRRHYGDRSDRLAVALTHYAVLKWQQGKNDAARAFFAQAGAAMPDNGSTILSMVLVNRAEFHLDMGEFHAAERDYRRVFDFKRETLGEENMETWLAASLWGRVLAREGKVREAEDVQRNALAQLSRIVGADDYTNVTAHFTLAETLAFAHRFDEAADQLERCLALIARKHSTSHPDYLEAKELLERVRQGKPPLD
ncbi:serine/threonine protein kinase [Pseudoxanthomonas helianthi]|uniref:Serine/threonine protein kinase n=1 Tax=Pseudoxanthomonas helianthi TaxID=1453541 RepID=A0A940X4C5_9GAMM|nr:serine/threonine-protein kinase [Pseudoxanthomonas helianthi]MBP3984133.1 serine/threonine protein kinase [Pseudoxanthomonas helianthi]